jgi:hypothetical protein
VAQAAFHIALWSGLFIFSRADASAGVQAIAPHEVAFTQLDASAQRAYRAIDEGMLEARRARERSGRWPDSAWLASEGIPPFADDPLDAAQREWTSAASAEDRLQNYLGVPARADAQTWVVIITEADPAAQPQDETDVADDRHQKLADGTLVHVGIWVGPRLGELDPPIGFVNPELGWRRVVVRTGR